MTTMSQAATRSTPSGSAGGLIRWISACAHALAVYWDRRAAIKALQELDDRGLRDIGLARYQIDAAVGGALNPDMGRFR